MRNRITRVLYSVLCGIVFLYHSCLPPCAKAQKPLPLHPPLPEKTTLSADARLDRVLSCTETGIPLDELLKQWSDSAVVLSVVRACKDLKIQVRVKERPLRVLMEALAELLPGEWKAINDGKEYRLTVANGWTAYRDRWWRLLEAERQRAFQNQRRYILERMRTAVSGEGPEKTPHFLALLPAQLQERIASTIDHKALYRAGGRLCSLPIQERCIWPNDPPPDGLINRRPPYRRSEQLNRLADKANLEFIADFYSVAYQPLPPAEKQRPLQRPLKEELDILAYDHDLSWKKREDGLYLFRNNRWYRDDYLEVPTPLLRKLLSRLDLLPKKRKPEEQKPETRAVSQMEQTFRQIELEAELATLLTPWQIANGLTYFALETGGMTRNPNDTSASWSPFGSIADRLLTEYDTVRFYAGLSPAQRRMLVRGTLLYASLSPAQREQVCLLCPEMQVLAGSVPENSIRLGIRPFSPGVRYTYGYNRAPNTPIPPQMQLAVSGVHSVSR